MQCVVRKRGDEQRMGLMDGIAFRLGYLCKRVLAVDLGVMRQAQVASNQRVRSRSPDERRPKGKDVTHWQRAATSLKSEVSQLKETMALRERDNASLFGMHANLLSSFRELERKLADSEREITHLRTDPFREFSVYNSVVSTIPINTEGKDALHWHQTCRTVQLQYEQAKHEVDEKTRQFTLLSNRIKELESLLVEKHSIKI
jgi:hypothetical protein